MNCIEKTHTVLAKGLSAAAVWRVWTDVNGWHKWDSDIEWTRLDGPFVNGGTFVLKPRGGPKLKITLSNIVPCETFTDCVRFPFGKVYSIHRIAQKDGAIELSHTVRVTGALRKIWWHLVAKNVAAGLEEQAEKLIACAKN